MPTPEDAELNPFALLEFQNADVEAERQARISSKIERMRENLPLIPGPFGKYVALAYIGFQEMRSPDQTP